MTLSRRTVILIVGFLSAALIGLVIIQGLLLRQAVALRSETFSRNVNGALISVVGKLEAREALERARKLTMDLQGAGQGINGIFSLETDESDRVHTRTMIFRSSPNDPQVALEDSTLTFRLPTPQRVRLSILDEEGLQQTVLKDERRSSGSHRIDLSQLPISSARALRLEFDVSVYIILFGELPDLVETTGIPFDLDRRVLVDRVLEDYFRPGPQPIQARFTFAELDSLVAATLTEYGLPADCVWGIIRTGSDSLLHARPDGADGLLRVSEYRTRLFPHDPIIGSDDLVIYFPNRIWILARAVGPSAAVTLLFILIIIACFIAIFRVHDAQRRFSRLLAEFVNNMTHEFKTPLTTISLAAEALSHDEVRSNDERGERYAGIIGDESARMRRQVEKILEMAMLERGDCDLNRSAVDLTDLIRTAVEKFSLRVRESGGTITADPAAPEQVIFADRVHLENVIDNLLDNAVKYVQGSPEILIQTSSNARTITLTVRDNGIGMTPEHCRRVFDTYYRVPTGDVHDVSGFGLGLSYVKLMVEAHGGTVDVKSTPGRGSAFMISLPLSPAGTPQQGSTAEAVIS
ncbi:sensor histidine kinase [Gemmatimonadota bacterium]